MSVAASPERVPADTYLLCDFSKSLTLSEPPSPLLKNAELSSVEGTPESDWGLYPGSPQ